MLLVSFAGQNFTSFMFIIANGIKCRDMKVYDFKISSRALPFRVNACN